MIRPHDREELRRQFQSAKPFRFIAIDDFLEPDFALEVAAAYPTYESARGTGREFAAVNEKSKVQVTDRDAFPAPVRALDNLLRSKEFMQDLEYITGIDGLLDDELLEGGGMHLTGPRGRLDVHVDFNYIEERKLHRRLNILVYLNEGWPDSWGGAVELWDRDVKVCHHSFKPVLNRCVIFETSDISFHGVEPVTCPEDHRRISYAAYYYTAAEDWAGVQHDTVFKPRPNEWFRGSVLMPLEKVRRDLVPSARSIVKKLIGRS
ncbi:MAG: 2OG-Fe(II) oxygenase [Myxococcota bacterium]